VNPLKFKVCITKGFKPTKKGLKRTTCCVKDHCPFKLIFIASQKINDYNQIVYQVNKLFRKNFGTPTYDFQEDFMKLN